MCSSQNHIDPSQRFWIAVHLLRLAYSLLAPRMAPKLVIPVPKVKAPSVPVAKAAGSFALVSVTSAPAAKPALAAKPAPAKAPGMPSFTIKMPPAPAAAKSAIVPPPQLVSFV